MISGNNINDDLETSINLQIKKSKFAVYKTCLTHFKLQHRHLFKKHNANPIFHLCLANMYVDSIETNVFLTKHKLKYENYKDWELAIFNSLKIPYPKKEGELINMEASKLLYSMFDLTEEKMLNLQRSGFPLKIKESDLIDPNEPLLLSNKSRGKNNRGLSIPLSELKNADLHSWSCPKFNPSFN